MTIPYSCGTKAPATARLSYNASNRDRAITAFLNVANPIPAARATSSFLSDSLIFLSVSTTPPLPINFAARKSYVASS